MLNNKLCSTLSNLESPPDVASLIARCLLQERQDVCADVCAPGANRTRAPCLQERVQRHPKGGRTVELGLKALSVDQEVVQVKIGVALQRRLPSCTANKPTQSNPTAAGKSNLVQTDSWPKMMAFLTPKLGSLGTACSSLPPQQKPLDP